ncbi:kidins220b, partial [Symbiodinium sp. CCMP2456]
MRNLLSGVTRVALPVQAEMIFGRLACPTADDFKARPLYVWYDYLCCPQGVSSTAARQRHSAIRSIPSYVSKCEYFVILCPTVERADKSEMLDLATWAARGWCRTERHARELSARKGGYTIVVECSKQQALYLDISGFLDAPGHGSWSRESDKAAVGSALMQMVWNKLLFFLERRDFHGYRFLLNRQGACIFNGLPVEPVDGLIPGFVTVLDPFEDAAAFAVEWFLHQNGFRTVLERDSAGWTPLCYAAIRGDVALVQGLLQRRADPNDQVTKATGSILPGRVPVLALAAHLHHNQVMETLIAARASVHRADTIRATPAHWASLGNNADGLRLLCDANADLLKQNVLGMRVFDTACCKAAVETMAKMLAENPETSIRFGLHFAVMFHGGHEKPIHWLIQAKADLEERFEVQKTQQPEWWVLIQMSSL